MRKIAKILIPAFLLIAVVMSMSILSVSAAPEEVTLEWTGGTQTEAVTFLNNAMVEAEAGKEVKVVLKADISITSGSRNTNYFLGTDAVANTTVTITGDVKGSSRYGITLDANSVLVFKGNVTFKNIVLAGKDEWSKGSSIIVSEGTGTFGEDNAATNYGGLITGTGATNRINLAGKDLRVYTGTYRMIAGNLYKSGIAIDSPNLVVAGNTVTFDLMGGQQDLNGGDTVTGTSNVSVLGAASVTNQVTAGNWQSNNVAGDGNLTINTTGSIKSVFLAANNQKHSGDFTKGDGSRSKYTLNVISGEFTSGVYLYTCYTESVKNLDAVVNISGGVFKGYVFLGYYDSYLNSTDTESTTNVSSYTSGKIEANISGGAFKSDFYGGSHFEKARCKDSYEDVERIINVSGGRFEAGVHFGSYTNGSGGDVHRGKSTITISGGEFPVLAAAEGKIFGGSKLNGSGVSHGGEIVMNVTGGTYSWGELSSGIAGMITAGSEVRSAASHTGKVTLNISGGAFTGSSKSKAYGVVFGGSYLRAGAKHEGEVVVNISGGTFNSRVFAGSASDGGTSPEHSGNIALNVSGGTFGTALYGGSFLNASTVIQTGDMVTTLTGGTFKSSVFGGCRHQSTTTGGQLGDSTVIVKGGTFSSHIFAGADLVASSAEASRKTMKGNSLLKLEGNFKQTGGYLLGGSLMYAYNSHVGTSSVEVNSSLDSTRTIYAGSYVDPNTDDNASLATTSNHSGDCTVTIKGNAKLSNVIYAGSAVMKKLGVVASQADPMTCKIVVDSSFTGKLNGSLYASNHGYRGDATLYQNSVVEINGNGTVGSVYGCGAESILNNNDTNKYIGDITINVNSAKAVAGIYGYNKKGFEGNVTATISENAGRVAKAWLYTEGLNAANVESSITYNRKVIRDDEVLYWKNVTANGDKANQPDVYMPTVYISSNGTGDGSSPDSPLGNVAGYDPLKLELDKDGNPKDSCLAYKGNALYRAFEELSSTGGRIVLVGPVSIDTTSSRVESWKKNQGPAEFTLPGSNAPVIVTSAFEGVDYAATKGAKLILDQEKCNVLFLVLGAPVTFEKLTIEHKYDKTDLNSWKTPAVIAANGKKVVVENTVKVTAWDAKNGVAGDWYPGILGGHRINTNVASTDLTIKAGNWSFVGAASYGMNNKDYYGKVTGNATLNIEGGKIESVYGICSPSQPYGVVEGKLTINITGGYIEALNATAKNGAENEIVVNIAKTAERVLRAYGGVDENTIPANATINYDRSVIRDDEVFYWAKANASGSLADQPEKYMPTIYIAANGTGDGSSPESPLGNVAGYDPLKLELDENGNPKDSCLAYKGNALYRAFEALKTMGGRIVIVGPVSIDTAASRIESFKKNNSPSEFTLPAAGGEVIITSNYGGVDYAATKGAKLILDQDKCCVTFLEFNNAVTLDDLTIEHRYDATDKNAWDTPFAISARCNKLVVEDGVKVTAWDAKNGVAGDWYPMILGGSRFTTFDANTNVTIKAGNWSSVYAGCFGMGTAYPGNINGNATVNIEGGYVEAIYGTTSPKYASGKITGKLTINVTGGSVGSINATQKNGAENEIVVNIAATAERVLRAYGGTSDSNIPANATINFARNVIRDDEVFYWTKANASGKIEDMPEKYMPTVYISANGTGDGSSPESPLGNVAGYDPFALKLDKEGKPTTSSDAYKGNALYRAISQLTAMGGRIVLVGPVSIDTAASRIESSGKGQSPSEFTLPATSGELVITSNYGGVDYAATKGAKLVLDQDKCCVTFLEFQSPVTFEGLTIEHRYDPNDTNSWGTPFAIAARGNKLVVEDTVKVTAWNTVKNLEGNWYPMILGGSRFTTFEANTNVTIKGGNWSAVYAGSYGMGTTYPGNIEGNATVNIMGGKIDTVYGTTDPKYASGKITGKLEINVTGGYVGAIFATQKNGAANEIVVNIAKTADRVAKVWGGVSDASVPVNGTVNYDRSVTRDDEVMYWTTVNYTGNIEDQPEPVYFTVYVANVEKGLGDGSSPENAIGHAEGYAKLRAKALAIIKANGGTNSKLSKENSAIVGSVYKQNALYRALSYNGGKLVKQGGKLVVCGVLDVDATDAMRKALADFWGPTGSAEVIITSHDGKTNFRAKGAKLVLDNSELGLCVELGSPTTFDNITIEHKYNSKNGKGLSNGAIIAGRGNKLTIGYNVKVIATDVNPDEDARVEMYPTLLGGHRYSDSKADCYVTVGSGQWAALIGGDYGSPHTGNATIGINGGKIGTVCGTINPTNGTAKNIFNGSVWIGLWAGEVDNVYVVGKPGMIWGDASIGLGGTKVNGKVRATHPDYEGDEIQAWVFNYTDKQVNTDKVIGFENPVPATGSALPYLAVVATVSLVGAAALIVSKKKAVKN